uniref:Peptidase M14 domain-containing protein n=1 Tax=Lygus hesperus TaxID=30085 RepID=A0A0K8SZY5_LYGHE
MKWGLLLVLGLASASVARPESDGEAESGPSPDNQDERVSYEGAQVIQVDTNTDKEIIESIFKKKEVDRWAGNRTHMDIFVPSSLASEIKTFLMEKNVSYSVMIEDVQRAIDVENLVETDEDEFAGRKGHKMTWKSYHSLEDIYGYLDFLAETYPSQVRVGSAGNSVEGRPIKYIVISSGNPNAKKFWIDGGIHAREWISPATVTYIISELVENRDNNQQIASDIDYYIVPVINPDGYEYTRRYQRLWRKNRSRGNYFCPGVDLNRNWGYKWGGLGTSNENCREIYRGTGPFSEPETRSVSNFILNNKNDMKGFITFHSYGQYILLPYGHDYNTLPPDFKEMERVGRKAALAIKSVGGATYQVGNSAKLLYPAAGGSDDWAKGVAGIKYAYTIELRDQGTYGFTLPAQYIIPTAKEAMAAVHTVARAVQES